VGAGWSGLQARVGLARIFTMDSSATADPRQRLQARLASQMNRTASAWLCMFIGAEWNASISPCFPSSLQFPAPPISRLDRGTAMPRTKRGTGPFDMRHVPSGFLGPMLVLKR
jgi:hypothetical protein